MSSPLPGNVSQTARLMLGAPGYAVGWQEPVYLPAPAAGDEWVSGGRGGFLTRFIAATFTLTTSVVVGDRYPVIELADTNGRSIVACAAGATIPASTVTVLHLVIGVPVVASGSGGDQFGYLPDILIPAGWSWQTMTGGIDVADQYSDIRLLVQRFPDDTASVITGG